MSVFSGGNLDTLGLSRTGKLRLPIIVTGNGSDITNEESLRKRAKKKLISQRTVLAIIDVAKKKKNTAMLKNLWNTYHCQNRIYTVHDRIHGKYCKNKICTICSGNRKAEIINKYLPIIRQWEDPHFLTLTVKSVIARDLKDFINKGVLRAFNQIKDAQRKRYSRGKGIKLVGIKSLECNFNPITRTYNPHLHIILPNRQTAILLRNEWIKKWKWEDKKTSNIKRRKYFVSPKAQDLRRINNEENALEEIIKYGTKIFTDPTMNKKSKKKNSHKIYASALYNILHAMAGHRQFDRFGFNLPLQNRPTPKKTITDNYDEWLFNSNIFDWFCPQTGEVLSEFQPSNELLHILNYQIDKGLE